MDAQVVCRSIGFGGADREMQRMLFGEGFGKILIANVRCEGRELDIFDCNHLKVDEGDNHCDNSKDVGVKCTGEDFEVPFFMFSLNGNPLN